MRNNIGLLRFSLSSPPLSLSTGSSPVVVGPSVVNEGEAVSLHCSINETGSGQYTIQWYKDGLQIISSNHFNINSLSSNLTISSADASVHAGVYTCSALHNQTQITNSSLSFQLMVYCKSSLFVTMYMYAIIGSCYIIQHNYSVHASFISRKYMYMFRGDFIFGIMLTMIVLFLHNWLYFYGGWVRIIVIWRCLVPWDSVMFLSSFSLGNGVVVCVYSISSCCVNSKFLEFLGALEKFSNFNAFPSFSF